MGLASPVHGLPGGRATSRGKRYWTDLGDGRIRRADLRGSDVEILVSGLPFPLGMALHLPSDPVPAANEWALATMGQLVLTTATIVLRQRVYTTG